MKQPLLKSDGFCSRIDVLALEKGSNRGDGGAGCRMQDAECNDNCG